MVIPLELVENPNISLRLSEIVEETFHFSISGMKGVTDPSNLQKDEEMHFAAIRVPYVNLGVCRDRFVAFNSSYWKLRSVLWSCDAE